MAVTARRQRFGINRRNMSLSKLCPTLNASGVLQRCLAEAGKSKHFQATDTLFSENAENAGVFLVLKGKVCLSLRAMPALDRIFGKGSLLGLPSTFSATPYSLTATAITCVKALHVPQTEFLHLMREQPGLCREATEMLGREMTFIQSALAKRRRSAALRLPQSPRSRSCIGGASR